MKEETKLMEKFVKFRIEGKPFLEIAKTLEVSNHQLIEWNKEEYINNAIQAGKQMRLQNILRSHKMDKTSKVKAIVSFSQKINEELSQRDLSEIPTDKLLKMALMNEKRLNESTPKIVFRKTIEGGFFEDDEEKKFEFNAED